MEETSTPSGDFLSPPGSSWLRKQVSKISLVDSEDEEPDTEACRGQFVPSPPIPLKKQLELDKEDESLKRWKEQLLGSLYLDNNEERVDPEVKLVGLSILAKGRPELCISLPLPSNTQEIAFTLKEGSCYNLKLNFLVRHNIVSGLVYVHTVWKGAVQVDQTRVMMGTFSPQKEPYIHVMDEETTPSGAAARGVYMAKTQIVDDDGRSHLEVDYSFQILKDW